MRKIYYAPGIISLIGYLFILPYAIGKTEISSTRVIPLFVPKIATPNDDFQYLLSDQRILKDIKSKKIIRFYLNSDRKTNQDNINMIRHEAKRIKNTLDSNTVIFVEYTDDLLYGEFFRIVDNCIADSIKRYASWNRYFVIFGESLPQKRSNTNPECFLCGDVIPIPREASQKSSLEKIFAMISPFSLPQIGSMASIWLLMVLTTIRAVSQRKKLTPPSSIP